MIGVLKTWLVSTALFLLKCTWGVKVVKGNSQNNLIVFHI